MPRSSTTTRSLCCITKPALCSTSSTAHPVSSRTAWICSPSRIASVSSRPDAGSSSSRSFGSSTIARANSTMRATPMGSEPANSLRTAVSPQRSSTSSARAPPSFSRRRRVGERTRGRRRTRRRRRATRARRARCPRPSATRTSAPAGRCAAGLGGPAAARRLDVMSLPSSTTRPSFGSRTPEITSKSVVLPAPFGPMIPSTSPALASRLTAFERGDAAEAHRDASEGQHQLVAGPWDAPVLLGCDRHQSFPLEVLG